VSSYVGREQKMFIVEEYDVKKLYSMLLKCYHYLHHVGESEFGGVVDHEDDGYRLDIFQMTTNNKELAKELVTREF
jgi:hypothetical protein